MILSPELYILPFNPLTKELVTLLNKEPVNFLPSPSSPTFFVL